MTRITQQQLESYLWGAAVLLRGTIDAGDYKQFIFPLLFFKRLCDVFDEETVTALKESGGDQDFALFPENHRFQIPADAHWREIRKVNRDVGQTLQQAMRAIEVANQDKLMGIFGDAQWTNKDRLSDAMLRDLVEHFSTLELTVANLPEDELGQGYEYLIKKFADDSGHTAAEFYTNRTVVHLMTEMLDVQPGESVYDPTCGSGGMLLSCIAHLRRQGKEWRNVKLYGQERNLMTSSIARMNCFLHGIEDFRIERGDTLAEPKLVEGDHLQRFDVVLANPPYSIKQWNREAFAADPWGRNIFGVPPQGRADYAFQQHILASLNGFSDARTLTPSPSPKGRGETNYRGGYRFAGLTERVRELRKQGTSAEDLLWELVRDRRLNGAKFRRQHQIGDYIVDFYSHEARLIVELDGPVHNDHRKKDHKRDEQLRSLGNTVLRFPNDELFDNPEETLCSIIAHLPSTSAKGYGGEGVGLPSTSGRGGGGEGDRTEGSAGGRCAVLWPHGVLFRQEEADMRRKLIEADLIECVLGLGPNLFYNSPMEACVVVCRTQKPKARRGKILFINAVNEVTRERAQSFLTDEHLQRIVRAYRDFKDEPGFTRVVPIEDIRAKDGNLSIPLYVGGETQAQTDAATETATTALPDAIAGWLKSTAGVRLSLSKLCEDT